MSELVNWTGVNGIGRLLLVLQTIGAVDNGVNTYM